MADSSNVRADGRARALRNYAREFAHTTAGSRVLVLFGPVSVEDRRYVETTPEEQSGGTAVSTALWDLGYVVEQVPPRWRDLADRVQSANYVFINAHGEYGEDGTIQGLLEVMQIPYTGSGVLASALCLDKALTKNLVHGMGVPTLPSTVLRVGEPVDQASLGGPPWMVKPVCGGSSVCSTPAASIDEVVRWVERYRSLYGSWLIEPLVVGARDLTVGILETSGGPVPFPVLEIITPSGRYGEDEKMRAHWNGDVSYVCPAPLDENVEDQIVEMSLRVYRALGCEGYARIDWLLSDEPVLLEVNTNPGLSRHGNFALAAGTMGLEFDDLVLAMLASAGKRDVTSTSSP